jgi:hypothetical protein
MNGIYAPPQGKYSKSAGQFGKNDSNGESYLRGKALYI